MLNEFTAGGQYGIELSSMNNYKIVRETIKRLKKKKIQADRFDECQGPLLQGIHQILSTHKRISKTN